jgi:hypothetical protein
MWDRMRIEDFPGKFGAGLPVADGNRETCTKFAGEMEHFGIT